MCLSCVSLFRRCKKALSSRSSFILLGSLVALTIVGVSTLSSSSSQQLSSIQSLATKSARLASPRVTSQPKCSNSRLFSKQKHTSLSFKRANPDVASSSIRNIQMRAEGDSLASSDISQTKGTILVVGATGTLGRQIVRRALSDGYNVRCLVRQRFESEEGRRVLQGWGATIVGGDLGQATSIPPAMMGVDAVIDCATARPEEPLKRVDWDGKVALIETAQAMGIDRYIFFSIDKCDQYPEVKLMDMKAKTEDFLKQTDLNWTTFRLCGFMQALISSYAIPIVEGENVWGTDSESSIAYINSVDAARLALAAVENENAYGKTLTLSGPSSYSTQEVISLCEKYSGSDAKVIKAPGFFLKGMRGFLNLFKWAQDAADRLSFAEVMSQNTALTGDMKATCDTLGVDPDSLTTLPDYLESFFNTILSKVQKIKKSEYVSTAARDLEI